MSTVAITGNTYPVKDQLKALGGRWDAGRKAWMVPETKAAAARALVGGEQRPSTAPTKAQPHPFAVAWVANVHATLAELVGRKAAIVETRDGKLSAGYRWSVERISETEYRLTALKQGYSWDGQTWIVVTRAGKWFAPVTDTGRGGYIDHEDMLSYGYRGYAAARPDREGRVWQEGSGKVEHGPEQRRHYITAIKEA